ncbi:MAG TPA: ABC transporter permease [Clostridiaceae bacterium]|nr:ABC transporter permease [Clostridiaceae bacterium]
MLYRLLQKMLNNKWMVSCLLIGTILAVAMVSSVPIYTNGVLQRMLIKDLENFQVDSNIFPGSFSLKAEYYGVPKEKGIRNFDDVTREFDNEICKNMALPVQQKYNLYTYDFLSIAADPSTGHKKDVAVKIDAPMDFKNHINIISGSAFSKSKSNGTIDVMVSEEALQKLDVLVGKLYTIKDIVDEKRPTFKVRIAGVYTLKDKRDLYWDQGLSKYSESLIMDYDLFKNDFLKSDLGGITSGEWYYAFDYHKISIDNLKGLLSFVDSESKWLKSYTGSDLKIPALSILKQYDERAKLLKLTLWILQVPILLMLVFFMFMVSQLLIRREEGEIAVQKSRGASGWQIFYGYTAEGAILAVVSLVIGPLTGLLICKMLGAANGFMEFVQRSSLPVKLNLNSYIFSIYALILFMLTMLIPVIPASRTSIVLHKQQGARKNKKPIWKKYFFDIILLGISCYGLYTYNLRQGILKVTGAKSGDIPIDPLLFLISAFFILGAGLLFLRIFPYIVRLIFYIGRKIWPPALYTSLISVGRSGGKDQFLMLFLIFTISLGVFDANAARTMNNNTEEKVKYACGADITMQEKWESNKDDESPSYEQGQGGSDASGSKGPVIYKEPPFSRYTKLSSLESVTKVFKKEDAIFQCESKKDNGTLMAIIPNEFGKIAWFRNDLLPYHWFNYLNLLSRDPRALLVSSSFKKKYKSKVGDPIYISWENNQSIEGIIFGFIDYWPSYNPYSGNDDTSENNIVVANLSLIQALSPIEPYEVWAKKKPGVSSEQLYDEIKKNDINITYLKDASQQIIMKKNDPMLQGTNGALTLGFIVTMIISVIGFLIYWIMSIKDRTLQFGILRAMGVSFKEIVEMLLGEQVLISGSAIIMGIVVGGITSNLFVPLLQMAYSSKEQVPPFRVVASGADYIKLYIIIALMMLTGIIILARMIAKINISQALKLGED